MASRPINAGPLTRQNARAKLHELRFISRGIRQSNCPTPPDIVASLEIAIGRRKAQTLWYTSDPDSDANSNESHQAFIHALIDVYETLTTRKWREQAVTPILNAVSHALRASRANKVTSVLTKSNRSLEGGNLYTTLNSFDTVTIENDQWSFLSPLHEAKQALMDLLAAGLAGSYTVDEVVIGLDQGVRYISMMAVELRAAHPEAHRVRDVQHLAILEELERVMDVKPQALQSEEQSLSQRSYALERLMRKALQVFVADLKPSAGKADKLKSFLNLDAFYLEAKAALQLNHIPASFIWTWEPYFTMAKMLAVPSSPLVATKLTQMVELENGLTRSMRVDDKRLEQSEKHIAASRAIAAALELKLNVTRLGASAYKFPIPLCLQSFSAKLWRHGAGTMHCSSHGDVGLTSHLYVSAAIFGLLPDLDESNINGWDDMETVFRTHRESLPAQQNFPKLLPRAVYLSDVEHASAELASMAECRARVEDSFLQLSPQPADDVPPEKERFPDALDYCCDLEGYLNPNFDLAASNLVSAFAEHVKDAGLTPFLENLHALYTDTCLDYLSFGNLCSHLLDMTSQRSSIRQDNWKLVANTLRETAAYESVHPLGVLPDDCGLARVARLLISENYIFGDSMDVDAEVWRLFWKFVDVGGASEHTEIAVVSER